MVLNAHKWHYIYFGKNMQNFVGSTYVNSREEKILGIVIDNALLFDTYI